MARNLANVEILTDTFNAWVLRTNEVIDVIRTEVLTANSTLGVTGASGAPRNARLWGAFTANNLNADALALGSNFVANSSAVLFGPVRVIAGGSNGTVGQVLTSTGTGVQWATAPGTGTLTNIASGNGVSFVGGATANTITTTGTITVRANTGIVVNAGGVSVNTAYLDTVVNPQTLLSYNWASPAAIGTGTANTGRFTTVTAGSGTGLGFRIQGDDAFKITNTEFVTQGYIDATTPASGGGVRVRSNEVGVAVIQVTDALGGTEWGSFRAHSNGYIVWSGSLNATGGFPNLIPAGTIMLFGQTAAPVGWTKITTHNNKALRVVSGAAGSGGVTGFTNAFNTSFSTDGHTLTVDQIPAHVHNVRPEGADDATGDDGFTVGGDFRNPLTDGITPYDTESTGGGQAHSHTLNFDLAYVDVILASKN